MSRKTFRAAEYPEYKAGRSATPTEFSGQLPLLREVLDALRIKHLGVEGFEADDVIATLTHRRRRAGPRGGHLHRRPRRVPAGQRQGHADLPGARGVRGVADGPRRGHREVPRAARALQRPRRARRRDERQPARRARASGPKTAAKWLGQYGDLAGVVAHVDEIKGKAGESLREHLDGVLRNRRLNRLVDDLDLPLSVDDLERQSWDREEVHRVFDGLEFRVLRERLFATFEVEQDEVEGGFELEGDVFTADDLAMPASATVPSGARCRTAWSSSATTAAASGMPAPSRWRVTTAAPPTSTSPR